MPKGVNSYDEARLQGRLWTPQLLAGNLSFWFDASDASTITLVSGAVSQWNDKSGNGRNATQATSTNRPAYSLTSFKGKPGLTFVKATPSWLDTAAFTSPATSNFAGVIIWNTINAVTVALNQNNGGNRSPEWVETQPANNWGTFTFDNAGTIYSPQGTTNIAVGTPFVYSIDIAPTFTTSYSNGAQVATATGKASTGSASNILNIGSFNAHASSSAFDGLWGEFLATSTYVNTDTRQRLEGYLAWKWGNQASLSSGHPYKNRPPMIGG